MTRCNKRPPWLANLMTTPKETQTENPVTVDKETQTDCHKDYGPIMPKDDDAKTKSIPKYKQWSTK